MTPDFIAKPSSLRKFKFYYQEAVRQEGKLIFEDREKVISADSYSEARSSATYSIGLSSVYRIVELVVTEIEKELWKHE